MTLQELLETSDPSDPYSIVPLWEMGAAIDADARAQYKVDLPLEGLMKRAAWQDALERNTPIQVNDTAVPARDLWLSLIEDPIFGDALFCATVGWLFEPRDDPPSYFPFIPWREQCEVMTLMGLCMDGGTIPHPYELRQLRFSRDFHNVIAEMTERVDLESHVDEEGRLLPVYVSAQSCFLTKDRDQGGTWIYTFLCLKRWRFKKLWTALTSSRVEDLVDRADPDAIFWKFDEALRLLPPWLAPAGYSITDKRCKQENLRFNPETGSSFSGAAPTRNYGVGGRKKVVGFDEFPEWEQGRVAWDNCYSTTPCRVAIGTPAEGRNFSYDIRESLGAYENAKVIKLRLKWTGDPRKNYEVRLPNGRVIKPWLLQTLGDPASGIKGEMSSDAFQRQYNDNWDTSGGLLIYARQVAMARCYRMEYNPSFPLYTTWDPGSGDDCCISWLQYDPVERRIRAIHTYTRSGFDAAYFIPIVCGLQDPSENLGKYHEIYDEEGWATIRRVTEWQVWSQKLQKRIPPYRGHFGDPFGDNKNWSGSETGYQVLEAAGIEVEFTRDPGLISHSTRIEATRQLIPFMDIDDVKARILHRALLGYKRDKTTGHPVHDMTSHPATGLEFFAILNPHKDQLGRPGFDPKAAMHEESRKAEEKRMEALFNDPRKLEEIRERAEDIMRGFGSTQGTGRLY